MRFCQKKESVKKVQRREGDYVKSPFQRVGIVNLTSNFNVFIKTNAQFVCKTKRNLGFLANPTECAPLKNKRESLLLMCNTGKTINFFINYVLHTIITEMFKIKMINKNGGVF